jgi:hypothetical protein
MNKFRVIMAAALVLVALLVVAAGVLFWPKAETVAAGLTHARTGNERAANGPLPGNVLLYEREFQESAKYASPGYYPSLNGAEVGDAQRGALYPQATFGGSFDGPNVVFAYRSPAIYQGTTFLNNRNPGELFLLGGCSPAISGPVAPGPYIAKVDPVTGEQIWRTYLDNANVTDRWIADTNLNILASGKIVEAWGNTIVLIDPESGQVLKANTLPTGDTPARDANFKHLTVAPDGTLILKNQNMPVGGTGQGSMGMIRAFAEGLKPNNSRIVAVHPESLQVLDAIDMPESANSPHIITTFEGRIAIYAVAYEHVFRYFWDPKAKKLSPDQSWVVSYLAKGQQNGACAGVMGDWIVIQTNGPVTKDIASSIVAINQKDPGRMTSVFPFGQLKPGEVSFAPPKSGTDPENNMIYSLDVGMGKLGGIKIDQATGELKTVFAVDNPSTSLQSLVGPKDQRVLTTSRMKFGKAHLPLLPTLISGDYQEQVVWRDAATGRILAESDYFEPMGLNTLVTPAYGGRFYYPAANGFIVLQVRPKPAPPGK